ncbi:hypothetical protein HPP92_026109 [Vanilla planifolia]|uniref:ELMO domain-containing protein n=1 Tax=Vanilla planifolia TaxID=51239 RepID=A0A835PDD2_VANPL|nr:hypothetical protein HPP92_026109 [Vanilla planifolia]
MEENGQVFVVVKRFRGLDRVSNYASWSVEVGELVEATSKAIKVTSNILNFEPALDMWNLLVYLYVSGSTAWIGKGFSCVCAQKRESDARVSFEMTPLQEECLQRLQNRLEVTYDSSNLEHQETLRGLWHAAFPEIELRDLISEQWKEMGWQGKDPSTDFRGGGFVSVENLLFFARAFPKSFQDLLQKRVGSRSLWEYPFAVAGVNITFMLIQMLDLQAAKPRTLMGAVFLKLLAEDERAFDLLYCITFKLMDHIWLTMQASYMDFNAVMKATRRQLERELLLEDVQRLDDMPSFRLLIRN